MTREEMEQAEAQVAANERRVITYLISEIAAGRKPEPCSVNGTAACRQPAYRDRADAAFVKAACPVHDIGIGWPLGMLAHAFFRFRPPADKVLA